MEPVNFYEVLKSERLAVVTALIVMDLDQEPAEQVVMSTCWEATAFQANTEFPTFRAPAVAA